MLAWAVLQTPFWTIDFAFHPEASQDLRRWLWDWVDRRALDVLDSPYGHPAWFVNVFADQVETIRDLEQAGFADQASVGDDAWSEVLLRRSDDAAFPEYSLPAGFTIRPLASVPEVKASVDLQCAVFESYNMTVEWHRRAL